MDDPWGDMHIVYCKTDGRMIAVMHNRATAQALYSVLTNGQAYEEDYEYKPLRQFYLECGYPADMIGERILFSSGGDFNTRPHPFTR